MNTLGRRWVIAGLVALLLAAALLGFLAGVLAERAHDEPEGHTSTGARSAQG